MRRRRPYPSRRDTALSELEQLAAGDGPIVAGPWTGGIEQELLYWIPLLNWLTTEGGVDPARITAVSRGGADAWYGEVSGAYVDLLDHFTVAEVRQWHAARTQGDRRWSLDFRPHPKDRDALRIATKGESSWSKLQPSILRRLHGDRIGRRDRGRSDVALHRFLPPGGEMALGLPTSYVALLVDIGDTVDDTDETRVVLERLVSGLTEQTDVVLLRSTGAPDALTGVPFLPATSERVHDPLPDLEPRQSLALLSAVVAGASFFVASYSELAVLGPYLSTPTLALYSRAVPDAAELETVERAAHGLDRDRRLFRARPVAALRAARSGSGTAVSLA
jgi:hypothetical protein